jgi:membrane-associated protease RseP (regulator of RpoE activity)
MSGWGVGGGVRSRFARGGMLKIGTVEVPAPLLDLSLNEKGAFANPYLAGNIGAGVLKRFTVTFDYGHKRMYLAPNESFAKPDNADRAGLWLNRDGDGSRIEEVVAASPAADAGLAVGDTIVKVGGQAAATLPLSDFRQRLREDGAPVPLTARKADGTTQEIYLKLRDLL